MLNDLHIVDFCNDIAKTFLVLYQHFPRLHDLYVGDLIGYEQPDEYGLHSKRHEGCLAALLWLGAENWIRFQSMIRREAVDQCVLTQKSFIALHQQLPEELIEPYQNCMNSETPIPAMPMPMIAALQLAHQEGVSSATELVVKALLSGFETR